MLFGFALSAVPSTAQAIAPAGTGGVNTEIECNGITTCLAVFVYYIGPLLASKVAYIGAYFFSMMISMSLNSAAYALSFLSDGWMMVRDLANMAFIFILIYIAMMVMLEAETAGTIKTLAIVIVVALLVNFSFFFTRVVIDTGNILAVQFYNAIPTIRDPNNTNNPTGLIGSAGYKDLSLSVMGATQIQTLLSANMFKKLSDGKIDAFSSSSWAALGTLTIIYLSVAVFFWMLFVSFISVGIKFLLRIVALWLLLIASPLAFVARTMHQTESYFKKWLSLLIQYSLYPAIFMFMFLMLTKFASGLMTGVPGSGNNGGVFGGILQLTTDVDPNIAIAGTIASVGIRMGFLIALLYVSLRVADWVCTETSTLAAKVSGVAGVGVGKAVQMGAGASAWTARQTIGRGAYAASRSQTLQRFAAKSGVGMGLKNALSAVGSAQLDIRNAPGASVLGKVTTASTGMKVDAGKPSYGKGGFAKQVSEREKAIEKRAKAMKGDAVDIQKAQKAAEAEFEEKNGVSYQTRVSELTEKINKAKQLAASFKAKAASTDGRTSLKYQKAAAKAEAFAARQEAELKPVQAVAEAGAAKVKQEDKERIKAYASRLKNPHMGNLWWPSRGSIGGAAKAEKLTKEPTAEEKIAASVAEKWKENSGGEKKE